MSLNQETAAIQEQLARYCRSGKLNPIKGASEKRLPHYRRLVYNVVNGAMEQAYPITLQVLSEQEWEELIQAFFEQHDPQSNQVWKLPKELYEFAKNEEWHIKINMPFLIDLLYFEWIEIEVYCMPDCITTAYRKTGDIWSDALVVNPEFRLIHLQYPVHKKAWHTLESLKGNYFVLVFREPDSGKVRFIELSALFALTFEQLAGEATMAEQALLMAAEQLKVEDKKMVKEKGAAFLLELIEQQAILGYKQQ